jgi:hypothetical protein
VTKILVIMEENHSIGLAVLRALNRGSIRPSAA